MDALDKRPTTDATGVDVPAAGARLVLVNELELIGRVGVYEVEQRYEQRVVVSLELTIRDNYDGRSDRLEHVYDYDRAIAAVRTTVESTHFNLLETMAERIAIACLADHRVTTIRVRIDKPDVVPSCRSVGIVIERSRSSAG